MEYGFHDGGSLAGLATIAGLVGDEHPTAVRSSSGNTLVLACAAASLQVGHGRAQPPDALSSSRSSEQCPQICRRKAKRPGCRRRRAIRGTRLHSPAEKCGGTAARPTTCPRYSADRRAIQIRVVYRHLQETLYLNLIF